MKAILCILFIFITICLFSQKTELVIDYTHSKPLIDGVVDVDVWVSPWTDLTNPTDSYDYFEVRFQLLHDDENIYLIVDVKDSSSIKMREGISCHNDGVWAFFVSDIRKTGYLGEGDWGFVWNKYPNDSIHFYGGEYNFSSMINDDQNGFQYAASFSDSGYCVEYLWPKQTVLEEDEYDNIKHFRFDVGVYNWASESSVWACQELWWYRGYERNAELGEFCGVVEMKDNALGSKEVKELKNIFMEENVLMLGNYYGPVEIYNVLGQKIFACKSVCQSIDVSYLKKGFYVLQLDGQSVKFSILH